MPSKSRVKVMNGTVSTTSGGLTKKNLKYNKRGRIVSVKKSKPIGRKMKTSEFFCVNCKKVVKPEKNSIKKSKARVTGQPMLKAWCNKCDSKVAKFVKK